VLGKAFQLLLLAHQGLFGPALIVTGMRQLLDALLDAVGVTLNLFVSGVRYFAVQRFASPVFLRGVVNNLNLDITVS
jgi:hypothetical protein